MQELVTLAVGSFCNYVFLPTSEFWQNNAYLQKQT